MLDTRRRHGAMHGHPGERGPLDGRPADLTGPRLERRDSIATDLTKKTSAGVMIAMARQSTKVVSGNVADL